MVAQTNRGKDFFVYVSTNWIFVAGLVPQFLPSLSQGPFQQWTFRREVGQWPQRERSGRGIPLKRITGSSASAIFVPGRVNLDGLMAMCVRNLGFHQEFMRRMEEWLGMVHDVDSSVLPLIRNEDHDPYQNMQSKTLTQTSLSGIADNVSTTTWKISKKNV